MIDGILLIESANHAQFLRNPERPPRGNSTHDDFWKADRTAVRPINLDDSIVKCVYKGGELAKNNRARMSRRKRRKVVEGMGSRFVGGE
jgi:hypothetical protein